MRFPKRFAIILLFAVFCCSQILFASYEDVKPSGENFLLDSYKIEKAELTFVGMTVGRDGYVGYGSKVILTPDSIARVSGKFDGIMSEADKYGDVEELKLDFSLGLKLQKPDNSHKKPTSGAPFINILIEENTASVEMKVYNNRAPQNVNYQNIGKKSFLTDYHKSSLMGVWSNIPSPLAKYGKKVFTFSRNYSGDPNDWYRIEPDGKKTKVYNGGTKATPILYFVLNSVTYTNGKTEVIYGSNNNTMQVLIPPGEDETEPGVAQVTGFVPGQNSSTEETSSGSEEATVTTAATTEEPTASEDEAGIISVLGAIGSGLAAAGAAAAAATAASGATGAAGAAGAAGASAGAGALPGSFDGNGIGTELADDPKKNKIKKVLPDGSVVYVDAADDESLGGGDLNSIVSGFFGLGADKFKKPYEEAANLAIQRYNHGFTTHFQLVSSGNKGWSKVAATNATNIKNAAVSNLGKVSGRINLVNNGFKVIESAIDFVNYQKDTVCEDGTVLSGDSMPKAALKAIAGVKISGAVMDANPALGIADLASTIVLGNTQAGDLLTPSNNIKNAVNLLTDMASLSDRDYITAGIQSGKYGTMLKTYSEIPDFVADVSSNIGESLDVATSDEFFDNLHDGIEDMYKDKDTGKIGVLTNLVVRPGLNIQHVAIEGARYGVKGVKWAGEMAGKAVSSAGELWDKAKNSLFNW